MSTAEETGTAQCKIPEAQAQHRWLERLVGDWSIAHEAFAGWRETVRAIGDLWIVAEGRGEMPGVGQQTTIMTLGYDPAKGKFVGTFIGSMMTHLWVYEGTLDGDRLVLDTVGPDMTGSGLKPYQDIVELKPDGSRELRSQVKTDDGGWKEFMRAEYRRV